MQDITEFVIKNTEYVIKNRILCSVLDIVLNKYIYIYKTCTTPSIQITYSKNFFMQIEEGGGAKNKSKKGERNPCRWPLKCFTHILSNDIMMLNIHFIHSFINAFILSSIHSSIHSFIHSFIH